MPNPKDFEDKDKFISACVSQRIDEGSDESEEQSLAICYSLWDEQDAPAEKRALTSAILRARSVLKSQNHWEDQERDSSGRFGSGDGGSDKPSSGKPGKNPKDKPDKRNAISSMEYEALTHELGMPTDMVDEFIAENPEASFEDAVAHFYDLGSIQDYEIARIVNEERGNSLDTATYEALAERLGVDLNATEDDAYGNSEDLNPEDGTSDRSVVDVLDGEVEPPPGYSGEETGLTDPIQNLQGSLAEATDEELRDAANSMAYQLAYNAANAMEMSRTDESDLNYDPTLDPTVPPNIGDSLFMDGSGGTGHGDWSSTSYLVETGPDDMREAMRIAERLLNEADQPTTWQEYADLARQAIQQALEEGRDLARNTNKKPPKKSFEDLRTKLAVMKARQLLKDI